MEARTGEQGRAVLSRLLALQEEGRFCDYRLLLLGEDGREEEAGACGALLCAISPVLDGMLRSGMVEAQTRVIPLHVSKKIWDLVLKFYCGSDPVVIQEEDVEEVLRFADMYELSALRSHCDGLLPSLVTADNVVGLVGLASQLSLRSSYRALRGFLAEHFGEVSRGEEFLSLEEDIVRELLVSSDVVSTEEELCLRLLAWLEAKNQQQQEQQQEQQQKQQQQQQEQEEQKDSGAETTAADGVLFSKLRLWDMSSEFLQEKVLTHEVVTRSDVIQDFIHKELEQRKVTHWSPSLQRLLPTTPTSTSPPPPQRRGWPKPPHHLLLFGKDGRGNNYLMSWCPGQKDWRPLPNAFEIDQPIATVLGNKILVMSQTLYSDDMSNKPTALISLDKMKWSCGPTFQGRRQIKGLVSIADKAYAVGEQDNYKGQHFTTVEEYNPGNGKDGWTLLMDLNVPPFVSSVVVTLGNALILVGHPRMLWECDRVQMIDVTTRTVTIVNLPKLPWSLTRCETAVCGNTAVFVSSEGDLAQMTLGHQQQHQQQHQQHHQHHQHHQHQQRQHQQLLPVKVIRRLRNLRVQDHFGLYQDGSRLWVLGGRPRRKEREEMQRSSSRHHGKPYLSRVQSFPLQRGGPGEEEEEEEEEEAYPAIPPLPLGMVVDAVLNVQLPPDLQLSEQVTKRLTD